MDLKLRSLARRFALITDETVQSLFGNALQQELISAGLEVRLFSFPPGEESKSRRRKESLEDAMLESGLGRDTAVIALGGNVTLDLAGFVAGTYCRGIPWVAIPTTLLAMADGCIGGKVGVNTPRGKNLIGLIYPPSLILTRPQYLTTLPQEEFLSGTAEIIKHGLLADPTILSSLEHNFPLWKARDPEFLRRLIDASQKVKQAIVENDLNETGPRRLLNFGHTIGHALETALNYQIRHGEAVAIGIAVEAVLSHRQEGMPKADLERIYRLLKMYGFSFNSIKRIAPSQLLDLLPRDKKSSVGIPRFVLLRGIGHPCAFDGVYCTAIDSLLIEEALEALCGHD